MVGKKAQSLYATENSELPVRQDVTLPDWLVDAHNTKTDSLGLQDIAEHRDDASVLVEKVAFDD